MVGSRKESDGEAEIWKRGKKRKCGGPPEVRKCGVRELIY
jgi:hypothetical protein